LKLNIEEIKLNKESLIHSNKNLIPKKESSNSFNTYLNDIVTSDINHKKTLESFKNIISKIDNKIGLVKSQDSY
jgi:hypothetical protein